MATMNRNINVEEINSDAFMGIPYLNHQSLLQKAVFVGSIFAGIGLNLFSNFKLHINPNIAVLLTILPLLVGVAYGCNYNEDLSLIKYFKLLMLKPSKAYYSKPTEDLEQLRNSAERIRQEEELKKRQQQQATPEEQRKLLIKFLVGILIFIIALVAMVMVIKGTKKEDVHHRVAIESTVNFEQEI